MIILPCYSPTALNSSQAPLEQTTDDVFTHPVLAKFDQYRMTVCDSSRSARV